MDNLQQTTTEAPPVDLLYGEKGPTDRQMLFRDSPARYKLYGGAVRGGKTVALCAEAIRFSLVYAGNRGFMCRHESEAFKRTTLVTLLRLIAEIEMLTNSTILKLHHQTNKTLEFVNKSVILYGALGDQSDFERIKSFELGWFAIDEASEVPEENFSMLKSRLSWRLPDKSYPHFFGLLASNPEAGWLKDTFVTPQRLGKPLLNHTFVQGLPCDNPYLPEDYAEELRLHNPPSWVKCYLDGSWDALEGQVWQEFSYDEHVIKPFSIPLGWKRFRAIDHGQVHPTCCLWFAIDYDGNIFVYQEYYSPGVVSSHCKAIKSLSEDEKYISTYLSPDCWGKTREKGGRLCSIKDEYSDYKISCTRANNEVLAGLNRVGEYFKINPLRRHPLKDCLSSPSLFIFDNCINLIREIPEYTWKKQRGVESQLEKPLKTNDDACDALRYGIMSRPSPTRIRPISVPHSFEWEKRRMLSKEMRISTI